MPRWLDRVVPRISIEGAEFFKARKRTPTTAPDRDAELAASVSGS